MLDCIQSSSDSREVALKLKQLIIRRLIQAAKLVALLVNGSLGESAEAHKVNISFTEVAVMII